MTPHQTAEHVSQFFSDKSSAGLKLPDGWFGRPHDNQHRLTSVNATDESLHIQLDGMHTLELTGEVNVELADGTLRLSDFDTLIWDREDYSTGHRIRKEFTDGHVEFVTHPTNT